MNGNQLTSEEREHRRGIQLGILQSPSLRNLFVASAGRDVAKYGQVGANSTQGNYSQGLAEADEYFGMLSAQPYIKSMLKAKEAGRNIYEEPVEGGSPIVLLNSVRPFYLRGIDDITVSDILRLMDIEKVSSSNLSDEERGMYLGDFKEINEELYKILINTYLGSLSNLGVGESIRNFGVAQARSLEALLNQSEESSGRVIPLPRNRQPTEEEFLMAA